MRVKFLTVLFLFGLLNFASAAITPDSTPGTCARDYGIYYGMAAFGFLLMAVFLALKQRVPSILAAGFLLLFGISVLTTGWPCYSEVELTTNGYSTINGFTNLTSYDGTGVVTGVQNGTVQTWLLDNSTKTVTVVPSVLHFDVLGWLMLVLAGIGIYIAVYGVVV